MVFIRSGSFSMGDGIAECGRTPHRVTLTRDYYLGRHEVSNEEFLELLQPLLEQS